MRGKNSIRLGRTMRATAILMAVFVLCGVAVMSNRLSAKAAGEDEGSKKIAITFDDGPHPYYTEQLLDGLKERGVKATFFRDGNACGAVSGADSAYVEGGPSDR